MSLFDKIINSIVSVEVSVDTQFSDLYVVGCVENTGPSIVSPVFRSIYDSDRYLVPPFRFEANRVLDGTWTDHADILNLVRKKELVLFKNVFPAQGGHSLWIDVSGTIYYTPHSTQVDMFRKIFGEFVDKSCNALKCGNMDDADTYSSIVVLAGSQRIEGYAIKAAIGLYVQNTDPSELFDLFDLHDIYPKLNFVRLVLSYVNTIQER